jgi:LexA-binding, inner membrane-associated putative hydrolase
MSSPVGHILGGAALYLAGTSPQHRSNVTLVVTLMGSILPDFDFLPGILIGDPAAFHHGVSHSLAFAVLFGALVFVFLRCCRQKKIARRAALLGTLAYAFHIVLDAVSAYEAVPMLWPLSNVKFGIDLNVFGEFHHDRLEQGIWSVVRWENLPAVMRELTILGIPVLLLFLWRERRSQSNLSGCRVKEDAYER